MVDPKYSIPDTNIGTALSSINFSMFAFSNALNKKYIWLDGPGIDEGRKNIQEINIERMINIGILIIIISMKSAQTGMPGI